MHLREHGGLLLAEEAAPPAAIRAMLKRLDPDLVLGVEVDERHQAYCWKVLARVGHDRPAVWIMDWRDDSGRPLPLTSSLVDEVASRRLDGRRRFADPLAENDKREATEREERLEAYADAAKEALDRKGRLPVFHRSQQLRRTRDKQRARGEKA